MSHEFGDVIENNKGKAMVKQEESSPSMLVVDEEQKIFLVNKVKEESSPLAPSQRGEHPCQIPATWGSTFLKNIIMKCVAALGIWNIMGVNMELQCLSYFATAISRPLQHVAFVFAEALARRMTWLLPGLGWAMQLQVLQPLTTTPVAINSPRQSFTTLHPLLSAAATSANHDILEATVAESTVHVINLGGTSLNQWLELIGLFSACPGGPPLLRLSVVHEQDEFLSHAVGLLTEEAVHLHVPFAFIPVRSHIDRFSPLNIAGLGVVHGQGDALVITSMLQLHRLIADEVSIEEADHNGAYLSDHVLKAFDYYSVLFHDTEAVSLVDRVAMECTLDCVAMERTLLREEVMDIVACGGVLWRERHEKMARWTQRMQLAGFEAVLVNTSLLKETATLAYQMSINGGLCYEIQKVDNGHIFLYSCKVPIFSMSTWQPVH
ncbi:hypothetical protein PR202_gb00995 [Eleusine coracana subsp. coracana]|uniref:Uncharacterized protein n=1 Tax=Eleusine coracana subsp. coracana TaxID=191504 RepID=A0AAV5DT95_ELECO|nr:hypothetical protein PR202_gb00995 [Eleusine coracana subsp. coracana]